MGCVREVIMTEKQQRILEDYRTIKQKLVNGNQVELNENENGKYNVGLNYLVKNEYMKKQEYMYGQFGYIKTSTFDYFEEHFQLEIQDEKINNLEREQQKVKQKKIFISHSSKDKEYVKAIVNLLKSIGLKKDNLFCSSVDGYGIPLGKNIFEYLREEFNNFELHVIFVHSNNFYDSPICLNEMGATWVVKYKHTSIILPDFDMNRMTGVISKEDIAIRLDGDDVNSRLTELKNELINDFNLYDEGSIIWEDNRNDFIKKVSELSQQSN